MKLEPFIARRYLFSKKSHNAINIISGISVIGIAFGTFALVVVLSAFNGLSDLVRSLYNSFDPDIKITAIKGKVFNPNSPEFEAVRKIPGVVHFHEVIEEHALLKYKDQQCLAVIKGVDEHFNKMTVMDTLLIDGKYMLDDRSRNFAIIGQGVAHYLNTGPSDFSPLTLYAPKRGKTITINPEDAFNNEMAYISGVFSINDDFDFQYALVPIDLARRLFDYTNEVSCIEVGIDKKADIQKVQGAISAILGNTYEVKNREQQNQLLFKTLKSEKLWVFIILVFILIVATFNIIGSLTMLIIEKKKDIYILWSMGAGIERIRKIFLTEGLMITIYGTALGLLSGIVICYLQAQFGLVAMEGNFVVDNYPVKILVSDLFIITLVVTLIGLFASWYPVRFFTNKYLEGSGVIND